MVARAVDARAKRAKRWVLSRTVDARVKRWTVIACSKRWVLAVTVTRAKRLSVVPHAKRGVLTSTVDARAKKWTVVAHTKRCGQEIQGTLVTRRP